MKNKEILAHIDHTNLKVDAKWEDIEKLCEEAIEYKMASVCIQPTYVKKARENFKKLNIGTVIGFPNGYTTERVKEYEAKALINDGADEIDMVIDITKVKNGEFDEIEQDMKDMRKTCAGRVLKIIVETCYLTEEELIKLCKIVKKSKADYIKTSTGFGQSGADLKDIQIMKENIGKNLRIKASGGIRTKEDMEKFIEAGCDRIGTSSAKVLFEKDE